MGITEQVCGAVADAHLLHAYIPNRLPGATQKKNRLRQLLISRRDTSFVSLGWRLRVGRSPCHILVPGSMTVHVCLSVLLLVLHPWLCCCLVLLFVSLEKDRKAPLSALDGLSFKNDINTWKEEWYFCCSLFCCVYVTWARQEHMSSGLKFKIVSVLGVLSVQWNCHCPFSLHLSLEWTSNITEAASFSSDFKSDMNSCARGDTVGWRTCSNLKFTKIWRKCEEIRVDSMISKLDCSYIELAYISKHKLHIFWIIL